VRRWGDAIDASTPPPTLLVGVSPRDGLTYGAVATAVLGAASGAAILAAWRLRGVQPAEALRTS
jgi:hypothetical protein